MVVRGLRAVRGRQVFLGEENEQKERCGTKAQKVVCTLSFAMASPSRSFSSALSPPLFRLEAVLGQSHPATHRAPFKHPTSVAVYYKDDSIVVSSCSSKRVFVFDARWFTLKREINGPEQASKPFRPDCVRFADRDSAERDTLIVLNRHEHRLFSVPFETPKKAPWRSFRAEYNGHGVQSFCADKQNQLHCLVNSSVIVFSFEGRPLRWVRSWRDLGNGPAEMIIQSIVFNRPADQIVCSVRGNGPLIYYSDPAKGEVQHPREKGCRFRCYHETKQGGALIDYDIGKVSLSLTAIDFDYSPTSSFALRHGSVFEYGPQPAIDSKGRLLIIRQRSKTLGVYTPTKRTRVTLLACCLLGRGGEHDGRLPDWFGAAE